MDVPAGFHRFRWPATLALHLGPAAATFAVALAAGPLMSRLGLPEGFGLTLAFLFVLTPIELTLLLRAAHRATGRWSLRALPEVLAYRRPMGRWWWAVPGLLIVALVCAAAWDPVKSALGAPLAGWFPGWLLPDFDATAGIAKGVMVATLLFTLLVDGLLNPTVEELYFRGYLLPRLPVAGWRAVPLSAALFAVQHYWQPYNWILILVLELLLTSLVIRSRSLRLGIVMHVLVNSLGTVISLVAVLS